MKTKLAFVLSALFLSVNQVGYAGSDPSESQVDSFDEPRIGDAFASNNRYLPYVQFGATRFFNIKTAKSAGGADLFVPVWQLPAHLIFTHLRLYDRTGKPFEGNAHLGYRFLDDEKDHMYGVYGAFDRKRSKYGHYFNQVTFGVEGWFRQFFIGGNYYQPIGRASHYVGISGESAELDRVQSNIWITSDNKFEKAMSGGDAEVGFEFLRGLVGYVGGYYFSAKDVDTICGPRARLAYDWSLNNGKRIAGVFDKIGLEAGVQRDKPRGTTYYLSANIRIGLLPQRESNLQGVSRHMVDLVRRDVDIVSSHSIEKSRDIYRDEDGQPITVHELTNDETGSINAQDFENSIQANGEGIVLIRGSLGKHSIKISSKSLDRRSVLEDRKLIVAGPLSITSPTTGKVIQVDNGAGSISDDAREVLSPKRRLMFSRADLGHTKDVIILNPGLSLNNLNRASRYERSQATTNHVLKQSRSDESQTINPTAFSSKVTIEDDKVNPAAKAANPVAPEIPVVEKAEVNQQSGLGGATFNNVDEIREQIVGEQTQFVNKVASEAPVVENQVTTDTTNQQTPSTDSSLASKVSFAAPVANLARGLVSKVRGASSEEQVVEEQIQSVNKVASEVPVVEDQATTDTINQQTPSTDSSLASKVSFAAPVANLARGLVSKVRGASSEEQVVEEQIQSVNKVASEVPVVEDQVTTDTPNQQTPSTDSSLASKVSFAAPVANLARGLVSKVRGASSEDQVVEEQTQSVNEVAFEVSVVENQTTADTPNQQTQLIGSSFIAKVSFASPIANMARMFFGRS